MQGSLMKCLWLFIPMLALSACRDKPIDTLFTKVSATTTNIDFSNVLTESDSLNVLTYSYFYHGAGVAVGDINNDGLQDLLFTGNMVANKLYLNKGNLQFEDISQSAGINGHEGWFTGANMIDINADGKLDLYICSADPDEQRRKNLLFINLGSDKNNKIHFREEAEAYALANKGYSTQSAFFDYDKDGDLDMCLINRSQHQYTTGLQERPEFRKRKRPALANKLFRNEGGRFVDVSEEAGFTSNLLTISLGVAISDINKDNWPDIYISNDFNEPDYLFINNRQGGFDEMLSKYVDQVSLYSMGTDVADFNNDELPDIVTLDMLSEDNKGQKMHSGSENFDKLHKFFQSGFFYQFSRNMLQKNNGDGTFSEIGQLAGVSNTDWSWAALFSDVDNDGYKDLFISNGYVKDLTDLDFIKYTAGQVARTKGSSTTLSVQDLINKMPTISLPNYMYQNRGDGKFTKKTVDWGLTDPGTSSGAAYVDLDNDGDLDLVVNNTNAAAAIYRNNSDRLNSNNYLKIKLIGDSGNASGIGTKVTVYCKNDKYFQEQSPVRGFQSAVDPILNFGVGTHDVIDSVIVVWPNDYIKKLKNVKPNQLLTILLEDADNKFEFNSGAHKKTIFSEAQAPVFNHTENMFNDFNQQSLMPNYLSRQGPCIAKADVNADGREDLFIGGAKGQPGSIFLQLAGAKFVNATSESLIADSMFEDVAAEFFDADNDGDADLYVASGGYEYQENDVLLQDRLYINNGTGRFVKADNVLPHERISNGCVKSADIDNDGDIDLFIGGRLVPGKYPSAPVSKLLINTGKGKFEDHTEVAAPVLKNIGMVTDALWIDVNSDKYPDLIVVGEWMPIKVFINRKGIFNDESAQYIKTASSGWWNRLIAEDFDGDGDKDIVAGNLGWNAQFHASEKEPLSMYFKDFDGNGSMDPIFCYYLGGVAYPAASRDDLVDQLPGLKSKFLEYHSYAQATISDLFSESQLKGSQVLHADMLSTVYLENKYPDGFVLKQLPIEAQYSPVYAMSAIDANGDGYMDLMLAGNNSWTRIKFGQYTANHGVLLFGKGKGDFGYVPQWSSGLSIRGDVRSMEQVKVGRSSHLVIGINNSPVKSVAVQ